MRKAKVKLTRGEADFARSEGEYWDSHSLADVWTRTHAVDVDIQLQASTLLIHLEPELVAPLETAARKNRVSVETWLNRIVARELTHSSS